MSNICANVNKLTWEKDIGKFRIQTWIFQLFGNFQRFSVQATSVQFYSRDSRVCVCVCVFCFIYGDFYGIEAIFLNFCIELMCWNKVVLELTETLKTSWVDQRYYITWLNPSNVLAPSTYLSFLLYEKETKYKIINRYSITHFHKN